ncbi:MAG: carboxyl-terminal processing protease [bacterium P3]|nr:MAG: carboxyl-terminal processing protease [bacterium P3]KWW42113.1 MAG: carboxyl-terminal processing protease [bacterium F083]
MTPHTVTSHRAAALVLAASLVAQLSLHGQNDTSSAAARQRMDEVFSLIDKNYVTAPDMNRMSDEAVKAMLKALDPHSVFIPAKDVQRANEALTGNFEGIGITFQINGDTIFVADVIDGGPSEKVGLHRGDRIIRIDGRPATGDSVTNNFVTSHLRGKKGTVVVVDVLRDGRELEFHIVRDKIPLHSVDTWFMAADGIGYIRLARFARTSVDEFRAAVRQLQRQGMTRLIFDLRGNTGGYLDIACALAGELLPRHRLIVYTEGRLAPRQDFRTRGSGSFREGDLIVLVDENSASASEIVSGAVQDWDRGLLIGRRTFGKGLVQRIFNLSDGSQVRLTTARYFTPSGRCIQKPYDKGTDDYNRDLSRRFASGELVSLDSIHLPDSLRYTTASGRTVYGGGGIMPDIFVPMDTMRLSDYYIAIRSKGLVNSFPLAWADKHRDDERLSDFEKFLAHYDSFPVDSLFAVHAAEQGIVRDTAAETSRRLQTERSDNYLHLILKAQIARNLFGTEYYYRIMCVIDDAYLKALEQLRGAS